MTGQDWCLSCMMPTTIGCRMGPSECCIDSCSTMPSRQYHPLRKAWHGHHYAVTLDAAAALMREAVIHRMVYARGLRPHEVAVSRVGRGALVHGHLVD